LQVIPLVRTLIKILEKEAKDTGVCSMKNKMLYSLHSKFNDIEDKDFLVLATLLDPRYKDKYFSNESSHQFAKTLLVGEYLHTKEEVKVSEPAAKKVVSEEGSTSKLSSCISQILEGSNQPVSTAGTNSSEASELEVEQYLTALLLDFKKGNPFK